MHKTSWFDVVWGVLVLVFAGVAFAASVSAKMNLFEHFACGFTVGTALSYGILRIAEGHHGRL
jgi:hypothetical protein